MTSAIEFIDVSKTFAKKDGTVQTVLDSVSFSIPAGKTTVIAGGSGSGKSVTLKIVLGLMRANSGRVLVQGNDVTGAKGKELEALRADKTIGSSLDAEVTLYVDTELQKALESLKEELRFVLITSAASVKNIADADSDCIEATLASDQVIKIKVGASPDEKCVRCWHHRPDVASNSEHPELCGRCVENVAGDGEQRLFA